MEPLEADRRAKKAIQRITATAQATRGQRSAAAYAARAWVQFEFFYDYRGAQRSLRLALRQDPRQQGAIDYQMHVAAVVGDYSLLAAACRRELRRRSAVRLRLLLAEADYHLTRQNPACGWDARRQMEICHAAAPHDDAIRLGLAALLLKTGQAADQSRAASLLREVARPVAPRPPSWQADYDLTRGVGLALDGDLTAARKSLRRALKDDPKGRPARAALDLLPT